MRKYVLNENGCIFVKGFGVILDENKLRHSCLFFDDEELLLSHLDMVFFNEIPDNELFFIEYGIERNVECVTIDNELIDINNDVEDFIINLKPKR